MKFNKSNNQQNIAEIGEDEADNSIMVVDDSKFARNILCDILRNDGFEVVAEAKNGLEAIEITKEKKPKYIFLDVEMPMLDGLGAIPRILEVDPEAHIIMCTAMGQKNIIVEAAKAGAKDYVIKPYKKENILRVLNVIIDSKNKSFRTAADKEILHEKTFQPESKPSESPEFTQAPVNNIASGKAGKAETLPELKSAQNLTNILSFENEGGQKNINEGESELQEETVGFSKADSEMPEAVYVCTEAYSIEDGLPEAETCISGEEPEIYTAETAGPKEADQIPEVPAALSGEADKAVPYRDTKAWQANDESPERSISDRKIISETETLYEAESVSETKAFLDILYEPETMARSDDTAEVLKEDHLSEITAVYKETETAIAVETAITGEAADRKEEAVIEEASEMDIIPETVKKPEEASAPEKVIEQGAAKPEETPASEETSASEKISEPDKTAEPEETTDTKEAAELIKILKTEETQDLRLLLEAIDDYDLTHETSQPDAESGRVYWRLGQKSAGILALSKDTAAEKSEDTSPDYYSFRYLWRNRFDLRTEENLVSPVSEQRLTFHNVIKLKRNDSFLSEIDNSCNGLLSGLAGAYLCTGKRLQPEESGFEKQADVYQDGLRVFIHTILEDQTGDKADIAMADLLKLTSGKEQNIVKIQVKSLSDAIRQLVIGKAGRSLAETV